MPKCDHIMFTASDAIVKVEGADHKNEWSEIYMKLFKNESISIVYCQSNEDNAHF